MLPGEIFRSQFGSQKIERYANFSGKNEQSPEPWLSFSKILSFDKNGIKFPGPARSSLKRYFVFLLEINTEIELKDKLVNPGYGIEEIEHVLETGKDS